MQPSLINLSIISFMQCNHLPDMAFESEAKLLCAVLLQRLIFTNYLSRAGTIRKFHTTIIWAKITAIHDIAIILKNPQKRKSMLQRCCQHGVLSLPNSQFYFSGCQHTKHTLLEGVSNPSHNAKMVKLENLSCGPISLSALDCTKLHFLKPIARYSSSPIVKHSFKKWTQFRRCYSLKDFSIYASIVRNHLFTPSTVDMFFYSWV